MRQLASYSNPLSDVKTKALRALIENDDRIVGFIIEKDEGRVFIYTDSSKWCDGAGSGTFSGSSESAAVRCFKAEVQAAEPATGFETTPDFQPADDRDQRLTDAVVPRALIIGDSNSAKHAYLIECGATRFDTEVTAYANNRSQAARMAERDGHTVRSVNMIG